MPRKVVARKRKETPAEQHKRFLETANEVGASEDPKDFEKAFKKVTRDTNSKSRQ